MDEEILERDHGLLFPRKQKKKGTARSRRRRPDIVKKYKETHPMCEVSNCNTRAWKSPHHLVFRSQGGLDEESNLVALCKKHHDCCHGIHADVWKKICVGIKAGY